MSTVDLGPLVITSDFDSGNILRIELVDDLSSRASSSPVSVNVRQYDYEINLWTKPDCHGTRYENGNRTWFYFAVKGGRSQGTLKLNVLNLNKQVKLFVQGMQPVYRVCPGKANWERIRDRLVINETGEHVCSISFCHRLPEDTEKSTTYFAFTYPFSYAEMCDMLERFQSQFAQSINFQNQSQYLTPIENEIYFHRECVCYSLEGRRVELITISSYYGISNKREKRLDNLFPNTEEERPFQFPTKKVVFLSARVHPGETPSSFVLNGFMKFILDKSDHRAHVLRRMFVFKFIPILNPDGVFRGHYRTDPRGVNLNRVYLNPSPVLHSPIYAARKLLLYYHHGVDMLDDYIYPTEEGEPEKESDFEDDKNNLSTNTASSLEHRKELDPSTEDNNGGDIESKKSCNNLEQGTKKKSYKFVLSEANSLCAGCGPFIDVDKEIGSSPAVLSEDCEAGTSVATENSAANCVHHQCAFEACDEDSVFYENLGQAQSSSAQNNLPEAISVEKLIEEDKEDTVRPKTTRGRRSKSKLSVSEKKKGTKKALFKTKKGSVTEWIDKAENEVVDDILSLSSVGSSKGKLKIRKKSGKKTNVSYATTNRFHDSSSGLFLYVDMHGHTTKRGIFMYGNHFPDVATQAECMLLPRLMALNCQHFDFSACNFTERLMNMKDRRDGASREGSGRVACLKLTGLVRSYTLECNYNTGRIINHCVARPPCFGINDPPPQYSLHPPKFSPELFENAGRGLAESLLDLTGHNPWSRLNLTEFKSLEGVRRSLVKRLKCSPEYKPCAKESFIKKIAPTSDDTKVIFTAKVAKKSAKQNISGQSSQGGPLGPRRENQNSLSTPVAAKASGSRPRSSACVVPIPTSSSILDRPDKTTTKTNLKKMFKSKKSFPKFTRKGKKSDKQ